VLDVEVAGYGRIRIKESSILDDVDKICKDRYTKWAEGKSSEISHVKSIADLKNTENFRNSALNHILEGEINRSNMAVGYHYEKFPTSKGKIIEGTKSSPNDLGVYTGKVQVDGVIKKAKSSFFPEEWSPQEVIDAINEAYNNKQFVKGTKNTFRGKSVSGLKIEMYIDNKGKIISAFPKY
ncbi:EndoU domain-containing protein, partial [Clostridium sporogenes]